MQVNLAVEAVAVLEITKVNNTNENQRYMIDDFAPDEMYIVHHLVGIPGKWESTSFWFAIVEITYALTSERFVAILY